MNDVFTASIQRTVVSVIDLCNTCIYNINYLNDNTSDAKSCPEFRLRRHSVFLSRCSELRGHFPSLKLTLGTLSPLHYYQHVVKQHCG